MKKLLFVLVLIFVNLPVKGFSEDYIGKTISDEQIKEYFKIENKNYIGRKTNDSNDVIKFYYIKRSGAKNSKTLIKLDNDKWIIDHGPGRIPMEVFKK